MLKRVLSLVLSLMLVCSVVTVAYGAEGGWTDDLEFKYHVLTELGVVHADGMSGYAVFRDLSKASFINFVCNMYADYGYTVEYSEDAIKNAENMGIIHKGQDDLYKPLNYDEAMTMLVRLLGYGTHAELAGGYPHGYISIANKLGLSDGLRGVSGGTLQEYDAITLLYNTINAYYVEIVSIDETGIQYGGSSNKTFLYEFRKIYRVEGVMQSSGAASIGSDIPNEAGKVIIGSYTYLADTTYNEYLGMNVEAYVQEGDVADKVLLVSPLHNKELLVQAEDIVGMSSDFAEFTYYGNSDTPKKAKISAIASVVYNGQPLVPTGTAVFKPADGSVRLVDSRNEAGYDTIFITDYTTAIVESVSKSQEKVISVYSTSGKADSFSFEAELDDIIRIYNGDAEIALGDLQAGDVLKIARSEVGGRVVMDAYLSRSHLTGTVTGYTAKEDNFVTVDGTEYRMNERYEAALLAGDPKAEIIKIGSSYTFYLDNDGEIVYAKEVDGTLKYGIVNATAMESKFKADARVRLFNQDGKWEELQLADKVKLTGPNKNGVAVQAAVTGASDVRDAIIRAMGTNGYEVIAYALGSDGKIRMVEIPTLVTDLDTIVDNKTFNVYDPGDDEVKYLGGTASFAMEVYIDNGATIWFLDTTNVADDKSYSLQSLSALGTSNTEPHNYRAYNLDQYGFTNLLIKQGGQDAFSVMKNTNTDLFVVEEVQTVLGEDGEDQTVISGMMGSYDLISYYCDEDVVLRRNYRTTNATDAAPILSAGVQGLRRGDVVTLHSNALGYVDAVELRYVKGTKKEYYQALADAITDTGSGEILATAEKDPKDAVTDMKFHGAISSTDHAGNRMQMICEGQKMNFKTASNTLVAVYDMENDTLRRGTINDIEVYDFAVVRMNQFKIATIVVYKNL
ncbi:MAG: hypothetical protein IKW60_01370 [Clostridia bacterium]|nr:hypothetical protein [Clostridia bacterium]